jgi:hypothetical protein
MQGSTASLITQENFSSCASANPTGNFSQKWSASNSNGSQYFFYPSTNGSIMSKNHSLVQNFRQGGGSTDTRIDQQNISYLLA